MHSFIFTTVITHSYGGHSGGGSVRTGDRNFLNHCASVSRPQPLSTITKRSASDKVMSRAGFINNVLTKIEEVWLGKGATPQSSPAKR